MAHKVNGLESSASRNFLVGNSRFIWYFSQKVSSSSKSMPKLPNTWPVQILILKQAKIIRLLLNQKQLDFIPIMKIASGDLIFKI